MPVPVLIPVIHRFPRFLEMEATQSGAIVKHGRGVFDQYKTYFSDGQQAWVLTAALVNPALNVMPQGNC